MVKRCAALFCRKELDRHEDQYPFPTSSALQVYRLRIWQQRLLSATKPNQFACARHFSDSQFEARNGREREIKLDAVPDRNIIRRTIDPKDPLDAVCRLCLERIKSDCHLIHPVWPAPEVPSAQDIEDIFGIKVQNTDSMPRLICLTCVTKVNYVIRIRNQYRKNDAIFNKKWLPKKEAKMPTTNVNNEDNRESTEEDSSTVIPQSNSSFENVSTSESNCHSSVQSVESSPMDQTPKIAAIASYGRNPVPISSTSGHPGSNQIPNNAYGELVYVQKGDTYQRFQIISSNQIGLNCEREEVVRTSECQVFPADPGDDIEILYTDEDFDNPPDSRLVKIEVEPVSADFGNLQADDAQQPVEEEDWEELPEKKSRIDMPFRYEQIKHEPSET